MKNQNHSTSEQFHPLGWLESLGQFLSLELSENPSVSSEGAKSVHLEMI